MKREVLSKTFMTIYDDVKNTSALQGLGGSHVSVGYCDVTAWPVRLIPRCKRARRGGSVQGL